MSRLKRALFSRYLMIKARNQLGCLKLVINWFG